MTFDILLTLFLVFLNGFFVAAEFAIVKVRSSQISLQSGTRSKAAAEVIIRNLDGFLAATQLGITLASLGLGWVGEDVVTNIILSFMNLLGLPLSEATAHKVALPTAFVFITVMHIVFGELAPKSLAIRYPTTTTLSVSIPLRLFYFIFRPFIAMLNGFANLILRTIGVKPVSEQAIHSEEELRLILAESAEGGEIEPAERELIQNVFDFDDRLVGQVMVPRIKISALSGDWSLKEAVHTAVKEGYSRYPVYSRSIDDIIGVVHAKDLIHQYFEKPETPLRDIVRKAHFITENKRIDHLLREFQRMRVQLAIVVSEYGGTIGLVTLEDILEELVGEIQDEHDQEGQIVTKSASGYRVIATSSLRDINKLIEEPFNESEEYETLAGLLLYHNPTSIKEGDDFVIEGYHMKVVKVTRNLPEIVEIRHV